MRASLSALLFILVMTAHAQTNISGNFQTEIVHKESLGYALHIPKDTKAKKPMIIFLHGSGEKGTNIEAAKVHGPFKYLKSHDLDAYVLAPQCPEGEDWIDEGLYRLIIKIQKENNIDPDRMYLTGLSLGGWETYNLAIAHPEMFAALVPISGFVDLTKDEDLCRIKDIPIKIFHGLLDDVVTVDHAEVAYKTLKACNANVSLTIFDNANHDSWSRVYDDAAIYEWMLKQTKKSQP